MSRFFPWRNEYSLKIQEIDEQHKMLVGFINELYEAVSDKNNDAKAREIVVKMQNYALIHFSTEEDYFRKFDYPEANLHIEEHQSFVKKISEFQEASDKNHPITFRLVQFLKEWLEHHIMKEDKKYAPLFISKLIINKNMATRKFFPWKHEYELGIPIIDDQHKLLIGFIDDLFTAVEDKSQAAETKQVLKRLVDYTDFHFGEEEKYFKKFGYIEEKNHVLEHKKFYEKIDEFQKLTEKNLPTTFQLIIFLKDWLINHIQKSDRKYAVELKDLING
jgi:hemerythrin-like metal-binding protein